MNILKLTPSCKDYLWGGSRLRTDFGIKSDLEPLAEAWVLSCHPDGPSYLPDGTTLADYVAAHPEALGTDCAKFEQFPVLTKFIDASKNLSIQVHPSNDYALKNEHQYGKTEMWYALPCEPDAKLYNGLKMQITPEQYKEMVENDTITDALAQYNVKEGDCFFIPAGRIHTIGTGCFVVEIQQTSDVTYRIYDFKRKDKDGNYRQLHTKEAAECIDYTVLPDYRQHYTPAKNQGVSMVQCPYFTTAVYDLDEPMTLDYSDLDSFVILIGLKGEAKITDNEGNEITLQGGESIVVPASTQTLKIEGTLKFLETYV